MITEFYIRKFTAKEEREVRRLNRKHGRGQAYTQADAEFDRWYNEEAQRQYVERETLKGEGWDLVHNKSLDLEERARGSEMVIYSHWHRASSGGDTIALLQYAGCWVDANGARLLEDPDLVALLHKRYPLIGQRRLKPGCTYVWEQGGTK